MAKKTTTKRTSTYSTKELKEMAQQMEKHRKLTEDVETNWRNISKEVKKAESQYKKIEKVTKTFDTFLDITEDLNKEFKQMGVHSSKKLKEITERLKRLVPLLKI
jgi:chromosome segregation ATPase